MQDKSRNKDGSSLVELLHNIPILQEIKEANLEALIKDAEEKSFAAGQSIIKEGSYLADLYLILQGRVEVRKRGVVLARLGEGQFFGEMAFLNDGPTGRSADIVATEQTRCLDIDGPVWYAFLRRNPDVAIEVIRTLADRLRNTDWNLSELQNLPLITSKK